MKYTTNARGHEVYTSHPLKPNPNFRPYPRHIKWMQFLNVHGPLPTIFLHEHTVAEGAYYKRSLKTINSLFKGGMIYRPEEQFEHIERSKHYRVYDLTEKGIWHLKDEGLWQDAFRPGGGYKHMLQTSTITATYQIRAERAGLEFIPGHEAIKRGILKVPKKLVPFTWDDDGTYAYDLIPDGLFVIGYPNEHGVKRYMIYIPEIDNNTEPIKPHGPDRKSDRRMIMQYAKFIGDGIYKDYWGVTAPAKLLYITVSQKHLENVFAEAKSQLGRCPWVLGGVDTSFKRPYRTPGLLDHLFDYPLERVGFSPFSIAAPPEKKRV